MKVRTVGISLLLLMNVSVVAHAGPFEEVYTAYKSGKYDEAITFADNYIKANASDNAMAGSLTFLKALSLLGKGDTQAFVQIANEFDSRFPNNRYASDMMSNLIGVSYKKGDYAAVEESSKRYLEKYQNVRNKNRQKVDWYLATSLLKLKKYDQAESIVAKALAENPQHTQRSNLLFLDAQSALSRKDYTNAYEKFEKLATADPDEGICKQSKFYVANAAFLLAEESRQRGENPEIVNAQFKRALELFDTYRNLGGNNKSQLNMMELRVIQCYRRLHKYDSFDDALKGALSRQELQSVKGTLLFEQGESYYERQLWTKAVESYDAAYAWAGLKSANASFLQGRSALMDYHRVLCLMNMGNEQVFETAAKEYLAKYPASESSSRIEYQVAMVPYNKGDWPAAIKSLSDFLSKNKQASESVIINAQCSLINCMLAAKDYDQARQTVQKLLAENPTGSGQLRLMFLSAMADFQQGKWMESSDGLKKVIEISPEGEVASEAALYVGVAFMNEAGKVRNSGKSKMQIAELEQVGRKYLVDWMKADKPAVQDEMDILCHQGDFKGIENIASKYLQSNGSSNPTDRTRMLNWMGLVALNRTPLDLQGAKKYFESAYQFSKQNLKCAESEKVKAVFWNIWIALYNHDQQRARDLLNELKKRPESSAKSEAVKKYQYMISMP